MVYYTIVRVVESNTLWYTNFIFYISFGKFREKYVR